MTITKDKVKNHLRKHHVKYIVGATVVLGTASMIWYYKRVGSTPQLPVSDGIPKRYQLGGPKSPLVYSLLPEEAAAYNRASSAFLTDSMTKIPGTKNTYMPPKGLSKQDINVFNAIGKQVNEYLHANDGLSLDLFDINRSVFEEIPA